MSSIDRLIPNYKPSNDKVDRIISSEEQKRKLQEQKRKEIEKSAKKRLKIIDEMTQEKFMKLGVEGLIENMTVVDGKIRVFDVELENWLMIFELSEEQKEFIGNENKIKEVGKKMIEKLEKRAKKAGLLTSILQVWLQQANVVYQKMWFKSYESLRSDAVIIKGNLEKITEIMRNIQINKFGSDEVYESQIKEIFTLMKEVENQEEVIGANDDGTGDLDNIIKIFYDDSTPRNKKEVQIFNLMRYGGWTGNSEGVKNVIADEMLEKASSKAELNKKVQELLQKQKKGEYLTEAEDVFLDKNLHKVGKLSSFEQKLVQINNVLKESLLSENGNSLFEALKSGNQKEVDIILQKTLGEKTVRAADGFIPWVIDNLAEDYIEIYEGNQEAVEKQLKHQYEQRLKEDEEAEDKLKDEMSWGKWWDYEDKKEISYKDFITEIKVKNGGKEISNEKFKENMVVESTTMVLKHNLIRRALESEKYRGEEDSSLKGVYADMTGLATIPEGDYLDYADSSIDLLTEFAATMVVGLVTMGAGMAFLKGGQMLWKGVKYTKMGRKISKVGQFGKLKGIKTRDFRQFERFKKGGINLQKFKGAKIIPGTDGYVGDIIGSSMLDGLTFYEGATLMSNIIRSEDSSELTKGVGDVKEIVKSMAFMGALNSLRFFGKIPGVTKLSDKVPEKLVSEDFIAKVIGGIGMGTTMYGISGLIDIASLEGWHPTWKELIEFVVLIQLMHLKDMGKK